MQVTVEYTAQIKRAAGVASETIECDSPCFVTDLVSRIAESHGDPLRALLLDADGKLQRSILVFVGDEQARLDEPVQLNDRDVVTLLSPISGG